MLRSGSEDDPSAGAEIGDSPDSRGSGSGLSMLGRLRWLATPLAIALGGRLFSIACMIAVRASHGEPFPVNEFDTAWYLGIVNNGYHAAEVHPGGHDLAFFPGWPIAIKIGSLLIPDPALVGLILANVLSLLAIVVVWAVLRDRFGQSVATQATLLLAFAPAAFVFAIPYSEGLWLLAAGLAFLAGTRRWRAIPMAVATVTRINGAPLVAGTLTKALLVHGRDRWNLVMAAVAGMLAFAAWFAAVAFITNDPLGFIHSGSAGWMPNSGVREWITLIEHPRHHWTSLVRLGVVAIVALGGVLLIRRDLEMAVYSLATVALIFLQGSTVKSDVRYVMMAFPAFAGLSMRLGRKGTLALVVLFALLEILLIVEAYPGTPYGRTPP